MFSPKTNRILRQIIPVGLIWFVTSTAFLWTEHAVTMGFEKIPESAIIVDTEIFLFASLSVFLIGLLVGFLELIVIQKWFSNYSFLRKIITKQLFYILLMEFIVLILFLIAAAIEMDVSPFSGQVIDKYILFFFSITHLSTILQIGFSLLISLLYLETREHLGHDVFRNFFTGKYHKPKEELRIFLFSDMKSSTTIAEKMGHVNYFDLLQDYYNHLSDAIVNSYGEVYQYVGDEIVISWNVNKKDYTNEAVNCYFEMKKSLQKKKAHFENKHGFFPDFKAGIHVGKVTTGEIGALKKEIFFTGDVLNTTSRMQSLCNEHATDLIISKAIFDKLTASDKSEQFVKMSDVQLKGKLTAMELYKLQN